MFAGGTLHDFLGLFAVFVLVAANGFFVAAEFSLVAVRRSRVAELVAARRMNARVLQHALDRLDSSLAATQLGVTISSLALGWIGEPALAHLIASLLRGLLGSLAQTGAHAIATTFAFLAITSLHIVLGELMPKSLALQRSERTALWVVRPLLLFRILLWPAITLLNGIGNGLLRLIGLQPGANDQPLHSPEELKMLVSASGRAGLLHHVQQEMVERTIRIGRRRIRDVMTPRAEIVWIDANDDRATLLREIRACRHEQIIVSRGDVDEVLGVLRKRDLLDHLLDGHDSDPLELVEEVPVVHESAEVLRVFEQFKKRPIGAAIIVDEYGSLEGMVTQTDLLEAIAGDVPSEEDEHPEVIERADGSLLIDGRMAADDALDRLHIRERPGREDFHTLAGFALSRFGRIPSTGDRFEWEGWRFEVVDMDGQRIDKLLATKTPEDGPGSADEDDTTA